MDLAATFAAEAPDAFFLDSQDAAALQAYLRRMDWITPQRSIARLSKAGDGNMNLVLRVQLDNGNCHIIKQSRPWVEKFPSVAAPAQRADIEARYYQLTAATPAIAARSPQLLHADPLSHILWMQDLGTGNDLSGLYAGDATLDQATLSDLLTYLAALHAIRLSADGDLIRNRAMRALNAEHIFRFPFAVDNGFDLDAITPGLASAAQACREDGALMAAIHALEKCYLADGATLLHGDFFPGSFLQTADGLKVIDPEFCFHGDAEFDVGVLLAHLHLAGQDSTMTEAVLRDYAAAPGFSSALARRYAGVEILRRLLGLAQLPLSIDLSAKQALIDTARGLLRTDG